MPAVRAALPHRSTHSIHVKAFRLNISTTFQTPAPTLKLTGDQLQEAMELRAQGWAYDRIGKKFGMAECTVSNAVLIEEGRRAGFKPLARDDKGNLLPASIETLRLLLRKGWKARDIQVRCAVSAACVAEQRRRYQADLKARGKAPLPPPGGGQAYSGARVSKPKRAEVESLLMAGFGVYKIEKRTGVSKSTGLRIRMKLVKRLKRKGECLPGCDLDGVRHVQAESSRFVLPEQIERLRQRILNREPIARAAAEEGVGSCRAYRERDKLQAELAAEGKVLLPSIRPGKRSVEARAARWLPKGDVKAIYRYRELLREHEPDAARSMVLAELEADCVEAKRIEAERRAKPLTFEEKLAKVARGEAAVVENRRVPGRALADVTFGGVATGAL